MLNQKQQSPPVVVGHCVVCVCVVEHLVDDELPGRSLQAGPKVAYNPLYYFSSVKQS